MLVAVCDMCGRSDDMVKEFQLPVWNDARGGRGDVIQASKVSLTKDSAHLCRACQIRIADSLYNIHNLGVIT